MKRIFRQILLFFLVIAIQLVYLNASSTTVNCTICKQKMEGEYSVDAWGNPFHSQHEQEGAFCYSCSRIISEGVTRGGYRYTDGRLLCSLCQVTIIETEKQIDAAFQSVRRQLDDIGIQITSEKIPIELVNLNRLHELLDIHHHAHMKGFTKTESHNLNAGKEKITSRIFLLFGLPRVEFEAVLAHELLHIWIQENQISLNKDNAEGFCNLGSYLIYNNDSTQFSQIHIQAMDNNPHRAYGKSYRIFKKRLEDMGWNNLLKKLIPIVE